MLDLDVDSPEKVVPILRETIERFNQSAMDLQAAWQDRNAGKDWLIIARELHKAMSAIQKKIG